MASRIAVRGRVRHHGEHKGDELGAEARVAHRRKRPLRGVRRLRGDSSRIAHPGTIDLLRGVNATSGRAMHGTFEVESWFYS
jgi:hypothetical protein